MQRSASGTTVMRADDVDPLIGGVPATASAAPTTAAQSSVDQTATLFGSIMNMTCSVIGGGVMTIPFAFKSAGLGAATIFFITVTILTYYSLEVLSGAYER
jgi:hypothetical protein